MIRSGDRVRLKGDHPAPLEGEKPDYRYGTVVGFESDDTRAQVRFDDDNTPAIYVETPFPDGTTRMVETVQGFTSCDLADLEPAGDES